MNDILNKPTEETASEYVIKAVKGVLKCNAPNDTKIVLIKSIVHYFDRMKEGERNHGTDKNN